MTSPDAIEEALNISLSAAQREEIERPIRVILALLDAEDETPVAEAA